MVVSEAFSLYPILFVNVLTALSFVDPSLEQAAANLGASAWRVFRSVTLPLMLPGVFAGASIVFIWSFSELGTPLMFDFYDVTPVQVYFRITEISNNPLPYALLIVTMLGCCLVYALGKLAVGWRNQMGWTKTPAALGTIQLKGLASVWVATSVRCRHRAGAAAPHRGHPDEHLRDGSVVRQRFAARIYDSALPTCPDT